MEELYAAALLSVAGFTDDVNYDKILDELYLKDRLDTSLYLKLQSNAKNAIYHITARFTTMQLSKAHFGKAFMRGLKQFYSHCDDIEAFTHELYHIWRLLPPELQPEEPFHTMSYADEPLSWGDAAQTRRLCAEMMDFYL